MLKIDSELDLVICGLKEIDGTLDERVTHVLSILDPGTPEPAKFAEVPADQLLRLKFHDIIETNVPMMDAPAAEHIDAILAFGAAAARAHHRILIHCHMGISRSTAAMLSLMAQMQPQEAEDALFARLRQIRPQAWPNSLMVGYADELLGRDGRLVSALRRHYGIQVRERPQFVEWMRRLARDRELDMAE